MSLWATAWIITTNFITEDNLMNEYEVIIEEINPCGGEKYANKQIIEVEAESPDAYVEANKRYPVMEKIEMSNGDVVIVTGNGKGNLVRYTFS